MSINKKTIASIQIAEGRIWILTKQGDIYFLEINYSGIDKNDLSKWNQVL